MKRLLAIIAILPYCLLAQAQEASKPSMATVTIAGWQELLQESIIDGRRVMLVILRTDKSTSVRAEVAQSLIEVQKLSLENVQKLIARDQERVKEAEKAKDVEKVKRLQKEIQDRMIEYVKNPPVVVEGKLSLNGKQLLVRGKVHSIDTGSKPTTPPLGNAIVVGELIPGKYALSDRQESSLAIRNGDKQIVITGKRANDNVGIKGRGRVTGRLGVDGNDSIVIEADQLERIEKEN